MNNFVYDSVEKAMSLSRPRLVCTTTDGGSKFCRIITVGAEDNALENLRLELDEERSSHRRAQQLASQCQIQLETHKAELASLRNELGKATSRSVADQQMAMNEAQRQLRNSEEQVKRAEDRIVLLEAEIRQMQAQCRAQELNKANEMALQDVINDLRVALAQKEGATF